MSTFIEDYLHSPSHTIASACAAVATLERFDEISDETIYSQLASGEFRLYEEMIFCPSAEDTPRADAFATVA